MSTMPGVVAINTFREAVRDRVLYNLIFFALLMIGTAILVGQISIGIERMVIVNLGLTAISLIGLVMAIFIGVGLVSKEMEKRTLYSLLSKPIRRWEFIAGKYFGLLMTLVVNTAFMTIGFYAALLINQHGLHKGDAELLVENVMLVLMKYCMPELLINEMEPGALVWPGPFTLAAIFFALPIPFFCTNETSALRTAAASRAIDKPTTTRRMDVLLPAF